MFYPYALVFYGYVLHMFFYGFYFLYCKCHNLTFTPFSNNNKNYIKIFCRQNLIDFFLKESSENINELKKITKNKRKKNTIWDKTRQIMNF